MRIGCVLVLAALVASSASAETAIGIQRVAWLSGCWEAVSPQRTVEEQWMAPRGPCMVGAGRTVRGDSLSEYELVIVREAGDRLAYEAHPSGQATATFVSIIATESTVVFENRDHDFPQRVGYRRIGLDSLLAWIEGNREGKERRVEFPYRRAACGSAMTQMPSSGGSSPSSAPPASEASAESPATFPSTTTAVPTRIAVFADEVKWTPGPPSLPRGAQSAVLEGDPTKPGLFTMRIQLPANYVIPPHTHPESERVTVLSGSVSVGFGERVDRERSSYFRAGCYYVNSAGAAHFVWTKEGATLQITGLGPWQLAYVDPEDDPRKGKGP